MSKNEQSKINYVVMVVYEFAKQKEITPKQAFLYLLNNEGIAFIKEHYEIEHTLPLDTTVEDLVFICKQNGGAVL